MDDFASMLELGLSSSEYKLFNKDRIKYIKTYNRFKSRSEELAKGDKCIFCSKKVSSFCKSHTIPAFILKNIADSGMVYISNKLIDIPLLREDSGVKSSGTFYMICNDCDSKIFQNYENPENYNDTITCRMLSQIAMKNYLRFMYKRKVEIELYNLLSEEYNVPPQITLQRQFANKLDLDDYYKNYQKARMAIAKKMNNSYYMFYCKKLDYVTPIAFQCSIAMLCDLEGRLINDLYYSDPEYRVQDVQICVFPLKSYSMVFLFIDSQNRRYRNFYKQLNKLSLEKQLAAINYIIFSYSEDVFMSKKINDDTLLNAQLIKMSKKNIDLISTTPNIDAFNTMKTEYDFSNMMDVPNLLSKEYSL